MEQASTVDQNSKDVIEYHSALMIHFTLQLTPQSSSLPTWRIPDYFNLFLDFIHRLFGGPAAAMPDLVKSSLKYMGGAEALHPVESSFFLIKLISYPRPHLRHLDLALKKQFTISQPRLYHDIEARHTHFREE